MRAALRLIATLVVVLFGVAAFVGWRGEVGVDGQPGGFVAQAQYADPPALDAPAVAADVRKVLVDIDVTTGPFGGGAAGTGIVLTQDGQVLTSHHVIKGANSVKVTDVGNGLIYEGTVLGYDSSNDIALVSLAGASGLPTARLGSSADLRIRQDVLAIGNAGGDGGDPTAVAGPITALDASIVAMNSADLSRKALRGMVEVAAPVVGGQSGGALADGTGAVVGVVTAASGDKTPGPGNGYAVPIDTAMRIVEQIRSGTPTETVHIGPTATLGVQITDAQPSGARVDWAFHGQPAQAAGIVDGDTITAVDGQTITTARALTTAISKRKPAETIRIDLRGPDGNTRTVTVTLARGTPS
nr:trypsin-like peptidase domain-containing protein [Nocardia camponoti]